MTAAAQYRSRKSIFSEAAFFRRSQEKCFFGDLRRRFFGDLRRRFFGDLRRRFFDDLRKKAFSAI